MRKEDGLLLHLEPLNLLIQIQRGINFFFDESFFCQDIKRNGRRQYHAHSCIFNE